MTAAMKRRLAKLEAKIEGDQIPIICVDPGDVAATVDQMIAAGELTEADRALCVYWRDCQGPNALTDDQLRSLLEQCRAEQRRLAEAAPGPGDAD